MNARRSPCRVVRLSTSSVARAGRVIERRSGPRAAPAVLVAIATLVTSTLAIPTAAASKGARPELPRPVRFEPAPTENAREIIVKYREGTDPLPSLGFARFDRPEFPRDPDELRAERLRGERRASRELADLVMFRRIVLNDGVVPAEALAALLARPDVETAYFVKRPAPSPTDIAPATPDFTGGQGYRAAAPTGVDAAYAVSLPGGRAHGIRLCDIEYNWYFGHEEFNDVGVTVLGPTPLVPASLNFVAETNHGTASLGAVAGDRNGYGIDGVAPGARLFAAGQFTAAGYSPAAAISRATGVLRPGDVILLELQMFGGASGTSLVPAEWNAAEYAAITTAVANGIVVVEAAGNGSMDLSDTTEFGQAFHRSFRDSGAILVGGATSGGVPIAVTNHCTTDSRMDLWSWGTGVRTTGYGDLFFPGSDLLQAYTNVFAGTSSASAIVAGCVTALQGIATKATGGVVDPLTLRGFLTSTGTPQASDPRLIGVQPDLRAATRALLQNAVVLPPGFVLPGTPSPNPLNPTALRATDLNRDGALDIVFSYEDAFTFQGAIEVALGLGGGAFAPALGPIGVGFGIPYLTTGDFDGDGNPDVAVTASTQVTVLFGDGFGGFAAQTVVPLSSGGFGLDAADVDLDGDLDLAVVQTGLLSVLRNNGAGGFTVVQQAFPGTSWIDLRLADMNADGFADFCMCGGGSTEIALNDGFGAPLGGTFTSTATGAGLDVADLDRDGRPDVALIDPGTAALVVLLGDGAGGATPGPSFGFAGSVGGSLQLADMNGDYQLDAVISGVGAPAGVGVLTGDGRGGFLPPGSTPSIGLQLGQVIAADLDGIPGPEIATISTNGGPTTDLETFFNPMYGAGRYCRAGNVDGSVGGASVDVLTVNGRAGHLDRVIRVAPRSALTIAVSDPPGGPTGARFALFAVRGPVAFQDASVQPNGLGTACFPTPFTSGPALGNTLVVSNNLGPASTVVLPPPRFTASTTRALQIASGLPVGTRVTLQAVIQDQGRSAALSTTNAIELEAW